MSKQNVYDNKDFFKGYTSLREQEYNANNLIEMPTIKTMLPSLEGKTILDLGCGVGEMSRYFVSHGAKKVVAVDISNNMIAEAKKQNTKKIEYKVLPMEDILTLDEKFDIVFSSLAFHYVKNFNQLIKNITKLLKPKGYLIFSQEHPMVTAIKEKQNIKKYIEIEGKRYYLIADYNSNTKRTENWFISGVVKYHRNFETIINTLINSGLTIKEVKESKSSKEVIKLYPKAKHQQARPYFLFIKAQKN